MPPSKFGFGRSTSVNTVGPHFNMGVDLEGVRSTWNRVTGNTPEAYIQSDDAKAALIEGFKQIKDGQPPTRIIEFTQNLVGKGMDPDKADKLTSSLLGHFDAAHAQGQSNRIQGELRGTPGTAEPVQVAGPGYDQPGIAPDAVPAQPPRNMDQADALAMGQPFAIHSAPFLQAPSAIAAHEATAGNQRAQADKNKVQARLGEEALMSNAALPNEVAPGMMFSPQQVAVGSQGKAIAPVAVRQLEDLALAPQRAAQTQHYNAQTQTEASRRGLIGAQVQTEGAKRGELGTRSGANTALADLRKRTDPNIRAAGGTGKAARDMSVVELQNTAKGLTAQLKQADAMDDTDAVEEIKTQLADIRVALAEKQGTAREPADTSAPSPNDPPEVRKKKLKSILSGKK